jgi:peptidoglycan/LPS O-acetylase OafA/YrhL
MALGVLRLILAFSVLYSHTENYPYGYNTGVVGVIGFFLISGFVMTALCGKYYNDVRSVPTFYADRLLRLYPQYLVYITAAAILGAVGPNRYQVLVRDVILNLLIFPYEVSVWILPHNFFLQPTWTLGLEVAFYAVIPFILIFRLSTIALLLSAAFFLLPYFGLIDTDLWGYRLLPGTLFMFLTGSFIYRSLDRPFSLTVRRVWTYAFVLLIGTHVWPELNALYFNRDVLTGLVVFIPILRMLHRQPSGRFDRTCGDLSYGVFLNHTVIIYVIRWCGVRYFGAYAIAIVAASSLGFSALTYRIVERPILKLRHTWLRRCLGERPVATHGLNDQGLAVQAPQPIEDSLQSTSLGHTLGTPSSRSTAPSGLA